jgi:Methyltransferase domain
LTAVAGRPADEDGPTTGGAAPGRRASRADADARAAFPDWRFAPNIGGHPEIYEIENRAIDPGGHVLAAMRGLAPWAGRTLVDLGCGTGFWLPGYAREADRVIGIEPDPALRARAADRIRDLANAEVLAGSAERLPLADRSVDVVHARFAYFLSPGIVAPGAAGSPGAKGGASVASGAAGARAAHISESAGSKGDAHVTPGAPGAGAPGAHHDRGGFSVTGSGNPPRSWTGDRDATLGGGWAESPGAGVVPDAAGDTSRRGAPGDASRPGDAGLAEVMRVLVPGGALVVVDNDYRWGEFAGLLAASAKIPPQRTASAIDAWWRERGATRHEVRSQWAFTRREDLAAVLNIEMPAAVARAWLARHPAATGLSYGYVLYAVTR